MNTGCKFFLSIVLSLLLDQIAAGQVGSGASQPGYAGAILLWNAKASGEEAADQESFAAMLMSVGLPFSRVGVEEFQASQDGNATLLVVPRMSAHILSTPKVQAIISRLKNGLSLMTDGESPLSTALHVHLHSPIRVGTVIDKTQPDEHLHWPDKPRVQSLAGPLPERTSVLYADSASGRPLGVAMQLGRGTCICLGPLFDELSGRGYSRFPTLVHAMVKILRCQPPFRRNAVDAYFDPGYRFGIPIEKLAAMWRQWGIRAVHAAAWYYADARPHDYRRLIEVAHSNGILVYAWLEWPHIGQGFWDQHPEWRQKNALLQDAKLDFLHLMDLQNPDCMKAALDDLSGQLQLDWDGIDIAEFTITGAGGEALEGPARPDYFVSFGTPMRTEFPKVAGFDPLELENPSSPHYWKRDSAGLKIFYRYRTAVNNRLLRQVIKFIIGLEKAGKRDWELIHTIVDNTLHPEFDHLLGFDLQATLKLLKEFGITLNVEDPYMEWSEPPDRYRRLRQTLVSLLPGRTSMIDINIVPVHPHTQPGFPAAQATGTEVLQQLQAAAEQRGRVCFYCESTVYEQDWELIPYAMAAGAVIESAGKEWKVSSPFTVVLRSESAVMNPLLDGKEWPCFGDEGVILPPGAHRLSFTPRRSGEDGRGAEIRLVAISDELLDCEWTKDGLDLTYDSPARCALSLSFLPGKMLLDGSPLDLPVLRGSDRYVVLAPSGRHRLSLLP